MKGLSECKASESNIRRIRVKDIIKEVKDYLKTYSSAGMDIAGNSISPKGVTKGDLSCLYQTLRDTSSPYHPWEGQPPEEEDDCCQWDYVTCDTQTGHVTRLYLPFNSFHGNIPESIGNITHLTELRLDSNNFSGVIPRSIGSLTKLTLLDLSDNSFYGTIPTEFGNLTNLVDLGLDSLGSCRVENLDWLSSLFYLKYLNLNGISLAKANNWVNVVIGLQNLVLRLGGCDLSQVMHPYSPSVNSSSSITSLFLNNNNLNSSMFRWLCPLIGKMRIIKMGSTYLNISHNKFDGKLSDFLYNLSGCTSALQDLDASSNQFTGSLSDEIQNFSSLKYLDLSSNKLNGTISDKLWKINSLQIVHLSSNSFRGVVSQIIGMSNLIHLDLSNNSIEGFLLNADITNLSKSLQYIDVSSNKLGPGFPKWIRNLKNLSYLDLSNNNISDAFPKDEWNQWNLSLLGYLNLSFNNISGVLPDFLSNLNLYIVDLSSNSFYGPVPTFSANISALYLSRNKFHGGIFFLCQMYERLEFLDLSRNLLSGKLPDCLWGLTKLRVLNLGHNFLSGMLPRSLGYLGQLEMLCLYNNSFSGELPSSFKNCTNLSLLDLGGNGFYGNVPAWIGEKFSKLYVLSLRSNNFFGTIPLQICQLVTLQILDLSINNFHGTIPSCVNNLTTMVKKGFFVKQNIHHYKLEFVVVSEVVNYAEHVDNKYIDNIMIEWQGKVNEFGSILGLVKTIDLSSNNLTGQIPNEVTTLHELLVLDLSNNTLVGEIPRDIGQMTELLTLNLSRNRFSGEIPSTMSKMDRLNNLDVSYNNLSGRVPTSTQLQSFPARSFTGNAGLCGLPTTKNCLEDENLGVPHVGDSKGDAQSTDEFQKWFYIGGATGFATAFWIACSALLVHRRLRHAFFHFNHCLKDWVYVKVVVFIARLQRVARS
ncbi:leucine-rich repeat-containing protein [Tanacetum coccineum]